MGQSSLGAQVFVVRLVWLWVLLGLLLLMGSGTMLFIRHRDHNRRAADQLEQVKMQMFMRIEEERVENIDGNDFAGIKKEHEGVDTEENISTININNLDNFNDNEIPYLVNDNYEHQVVTTGMNFILNETDENSNYADPEIEQREHIEYIYDVDYEEEIQEEIKSVETQEIKKDTKYALKKSPKKKTYKVKNNNKEKYSFSMDNKKSEELIEDDLFNKCNYPPPCPVHPPGLLGVLEVPNEVNEVPASVSEDVRIGGSWWPMECQARYRVAVVIPYNNQQKQILPFLQHIHGFLKRQQLNYTLFFIQQHGEEVLNHGRLHNVGYHLTKSYGPWDCWIFHGMNLLPLDDRHLYHCDPFPRHLSVRTQTIPLFPVNELEFYKAGFGGATMLTQEHMEATNGWSNKFWDDDDLGKNMKWRLAWQDLPIWRYPPIFANYRIIGNLTKNKWVKNIMQDMWVKYMGVKTSDFKKDGLSNITEYKVLNVTQAPLYTNFLVDIGTKEDPRQHLDHQRGSKTTP